MEDISVDVDGLADQIRENCEKEGFTIKLWIPPIREEDNMVGAHITPLVDFEGYASPIVLAFAVKTLEQTVEQLLAYEDVDTALEMLEDCVGNCRTINIKGKKGDQND